ncbi:hypothetical protein K7X08_029950 [Anisodus acutangulus]|uniref:Heat shock protein 70 n=1 Tax=Anisodus acutangulus TaxID=402998 RepID=A0A9Q1LL56_9SOLA|nr:hypothetical protein K7X08_029950 [Anisodus acutangulus]
MEEKNPKVIENDEGCRTISCMVAFNPKGELLVDTPAKYQAVSNPKRLIGRRFDDPEMKMEMKKRQATKDPGRLSGLDVQKIIDESIAAAFSYGMNDKKRSCCCFHLGGGTFDISILKISNGSFEVKTTNSNTSLGGVAEMIFDNALIQFSIEDFCSKEGCGLSNHMALQRLREAAEIAKNELSSKYEARIKLLSVSTYKEKERHLMVNHLINRTRDLCYNCVNDAGFSYEDVNEVFLVGGKTCVRMMQKAVKEMFGKILRKGVMNPDEAFAIFGVKSLPNKRN